MSISNKTPFPARAFASELIACHLSGRNDMASNVAWETDWTAALARARSEGKRVLLSFFKPG